MERSTRCIRSCSCFETFSLAVIVIGLVSGLAFAVYGIIQDEFNTSASCYLTIFIVNCCFALVYVVKGVKNEDPYDLVIVVLSVAPPMVYIVVNYIIDVQTTLKEVRLIVGSVFAPLIAGLGLCLFGKYAKSKNFIKRNGLLSEPDASWSTERTNKMNKLERPLRTMLLFFMLLNVNLQIDISAAVFALMSGYTVDIKSFSIHHKGAMIVFFIVLFFAFLCWLIGHLSVRYEKKRLLFVFWFSSTFLVAAGIYLMVQAAIDLDKNPTDRTVIQIALGTSAIMIFFRFITFVASSRTLKNFGKGLREEVFGSTPEQHPLISRSPITDSSIQHGS